MRCGGLKSESSRIDTIDRNGKTAGTKKKTSYDCADPNAHKGRMHASHISSHKSNNSTITKSTCFFASFSSTVSITSCPG